MLDLLIINPGAAHGIYGVLGDSLVAVEPPLWCRLIAGYAWDNGFSVKIIDAEAEQQGPHEVGQLVRDMNPRLVCIAVYGHQPSASTQQMVGAGKIARSIKAQCSVPIIMVGGHVSALPGRTLAEEQIDYACVGEGPVTVVDLLRWQRGLGPAVASSILNEFPKAPSLDDIPGLVWWLGRVPTINNPAPLLDVDDLHGRAWDLLPMNLYRAHNWQAFGNLSERQPYASIYTTLGCPYKCSFCCINSPFGSNQYRMRNPETVVSEIVALYHEYRVKTFKIVDEMFILNERHYTAICKGLLDSGIADDLNIWAYARVDTVKPETLTMLRKAGFRWLALGIESGSKHVRDGSNKRLKNDDIVDVVRSIQAADINVIGNYIFGLPDDTMASMCETFDLALELNTEFANFYCAMAYPGSKLYDDEVKRGGGALPKTWRAYSQHNEDCTPLPTEQLTAQQVLKYRDDAFNAYFTHLPYLAMINRKFGAETLEHVKQMTTYKLRRKLLEQAA